MSTTTEPRRGSWPLRVVLFAGMILCGMNLLSGGPLFAVWVGSKVQGGSSGSGMGAIAAVVGVLIVIELVLVRILSYLTARYDAATGFERGRHQTAWLKAQSAERQGFGGVARRISPSERVLAVIVVLGVVGFEAWFFFFAGSALPNQ